MGHVPTIGMSVCSGGSHFGLSVALQLNVAGSKKLCLRAELAFGNVLVPQEY